MKKDPNIKIMLFLIFYMFKMINAYQSDFNNMFNFSFQVESSFSFNLDTLESDPWSSTHSFLRPTADCSIKSSNVFMKQSFEYNFTEETKGLVLENMLINNNILYQIYTYADSQNNQRNLRVYNLIIDDTNYRINDLQLLWQKNLGVTKSVTFMEKIGDCLMLFSEDKAFFYQENSTSIIDYSLNLTGDISIDFPLTNAPTQLIWNEVFFSFIFPQNGKNFLVNPLTRIVSEIKDAGDIILAQPNLLFTCLNYVFFYDQNLINIKQMINVDNSYSFSSIKTIQCPLINLKGVIKSQRFLLFFNQTHVLESAFVNDCFDIQTLFQFSLGDIFQKSNMAYFAETIENVYVNTMVLVIQTNKNDVFIKRLGVPNEDFLFFNFSTIYSLSTIAFLPFNLKDLPILTFLSNSSSTLLLNFQIIEKSQEDLHCDLTIDELTVSVSTQTRFCNNSIYNFTEELLNNNTLYNPNVSCLQYNNFFLTKQELGISLKVIISVVSIVSGLCFCLSAGYLMRRFYLKRNRKNQYLDENYEEVNELDFDRERIRGLTNIGQESDSFRYKGNSPAVNSHRGLLNKQMEIELEQKEGKNKANFELSRISLKMEDISFSTPQKSEENRLKMNQEDIAEESKSQEAKIIFVKESMNM